MQHYALQITHTRKGLIKNVISSKKENVIGNQSRRKVFEYANANEFSNIIFAHHLKDKTKLPYQNKITKLFCHIKPKSEIEVWSTHRSHQVWHWSLQQHTGLMYKAPALTSEDISCLPTSTGEEVTWATTGEASGLQCGITLTVHLSPSSLLSAYNINSLDHRLAAFRTDPWKFLGRLNKYCSLKISSLLPTHTPTHPHTQCTSALQWWGSRNLGTLIWILKAPYPHRFKL